MQSPLALWCHQRLPELWSVASNAALTAAVQASASHTHRDTHTVGHNLGTAPLDTQQVLGQDCLPNRTNRIRIDKLAMANHCFDTACLNMKISGQLAKKEGR